LAKESDVGVGATGADVVLVVRLTEVAVASRCCDVGLRVLA